MRAEDDWIEKRDEKAMDLPMVKCEKLVCRGERTLRVRVMVIAMFEPSHDQTDCTSSPLQETSGIKLCNMALKGNNQISKAFTSSP